MKFILMKKKKKLKDSAQSGEFTSPLADSFSGHAQAEIHGNLARRRAKALARYARTIPLKPGTFSRSRDSDRYTSVPAHCRNGKIISIREGRCCTREQSVDAKVSPPFSLCPLRLRLCNRMSTSPESTAIDALLLSYICLAPFPTEIKDFQTLHTI